MLSMKLFQMSINGQQHGFQMRHSHGTPHACMHTHLMDHASYLAVVNNWGGVLN